MGHWSNGIPRAPVAGGPCWPLPFLPLCRGTRAHAPRAARRAAPGAYREIACVGARVDRLPRMPPGSGKPVVLLIAPMRRLGFTGCISLMPSSSPVFLRAAPAALLPCGFSQVPEVPMDRAVFIESDDIDERPVQLTAWDIELIQLGPGPIQIARTRGRSTVRGTSGPPEQPVVLGVGTR
jgi:hypothetical protein